MAIKTREDLDEIISAINKLISLGVYPLEFGMDINTLCDLTYCYPTVDKALFEADENGLIDLWKNVSKYSFSIMGIPIKPKRQYEICIRKKENSDV